MIESITRLDECTAEQLAAEDRADAYRSELADFEEAYNRALFLSEVTASARREPTEAELEEHRKQQIREHIDSLNALIDEQPGNPGWINAVLSISALSNALGIGSAA